MAYKDIIEMANSSSLIARVVACVAGEGIENPAQWVSQRTWKIASSPGWANQWSYAVDTATVNVNPDTGARSDVISDANILSAVQTIIAAEGT